MDEATAEKARTQGRTVTLTVGGTVWHGHALFLPPFVLGQAVTGPGRTAVAVTGYSIVDAADPDSSEIFFRVDGRSAVWTALSAQDAPDSFKEHWLSDCRWLAAQAAHMGTDSLQPSMFLHMGRFDEAVEAAADHFGSRFPVPAVLQKKRSSRRRLPISRLTSPLGGKKVGSFLRDRRATLPWPRHGASSSPEHTLRTIAEEFRDFAYHLADRSVAAGFEAWFRKAGL